MRFPDQNCNDPTTSSTLQSPLLRSLHVRRQPSLELAGAPGQGQHPVRTKQLIDSEIDFRWGHPPPPLPAPPPRGPSRAPAATTTDAVAAATASSAPDERSVCPPTVFFDGPSHCSVPTPPRLPARSLPPKPSARPQQASQPRTEGPPPLPPPHHARQGRTGKRGGAALQKIDAPPQPPPPPPFPSPVHWVGRGAAGNGRRAARRRGLSPTHTP